MVNYTASISKRKKIVDRSLRITNTDRAAAKSAAGIETTLIREAINTPLFDCVFFYGRSLTVMVSHSGFLREGHPRGTVVSTRSARHPEIETSEWWDTTLYFKLSLARICLKAGV